MCWNKACNFQLLRKLKDSGMNWNWLCDPTGAPHSNRFGRGSQRVIFFLLGVVLIVVSILAFVMAL